MKPKEDERVRQKVFPLFFCIEYEYFRFLFMINPRVELAENVFNWRNSTETSEINAGYETVVCLKKIPLR